ncbi:MAG TPA: LysE family translocator, partial [Alphaproteobacteria bacterium]|nr:LysE family translocator [Alphaproteobacteria bacterium]
MHPDLPLVAMLSILGTLAIGAMSPGPSFVVVVRASAGLSRRDGLASALGMGCGGLVFAGLALAGLQALLLQVAWLYLVLKVAGGAYLVYLGWRIWRGASTPLIAEAGAAPASGGWRRSFAIAFATQISNPKTAIWYASVFAAF